MVYFHFLKTGDFAAFSDVWFEAIWEQHVLYWPPQDRSDNGLMDHPCPVCSSMALDTLDPDARNQAIAAVEPKVHPPGPPDFRRSTCQPTKTHLPRIDLFKRPTARRSKIEGSRGLQTLQDRSYEIDNELQWQATLKELTSSQLVTGRRWLSFNPKAKLKHSLPSSSPFLVFAGPSTRSSSVKHGFVRLPVSPQKRKRRATGDFNDLPELLPGSDDFEDQDDTAPYDEYHLDPEAYTLAMAGDIEDIATAPDGVFAR
ncbi:hypothetical protein IW261DRAFT_1574851 [Armillaria novae-zelandiae]|uniref:Uncharacterized protein n=1 Tax=Armillaria novae-zelandiae TaxID=153914 RepID=A0AA39NHY1_9AGAR|nr:hypothetical protein IW261DRAFT_1574851 [Armillaria novae-zelandiae]